MVIVKKEIFFLGYMKKSRQVREAERSPDINLPLMIDFHCT